MNVRQGTVAVMQMLFVPTIQDLTLVHVRLDTMGTEQLVQVTHVLVIIDIKDHATLVLVDNGMPQHKNSFWLLNGMGSGLGTTITIFIIVFQVHVQNLCNPVTVCSPLVNKSLKQMDP